MQSRPRPTPGTHARDDPPAVSAADRGVLSGMAEHVREHASLEYVAVFRHAAKSHTPLEELARASMLDVEEMSRVRTAGHAAVRGMRRFARRAVTLPGGVYVVAAETAGEEVVSVVASGARGHRLPAEVNAGLVDLVQVTARILSDPDAHPRSGATATPPAAPPRSRSVAYGSRFGDVLAFLQRPPILAETRRRLTDALDQKHVAIGDAIEAIETDIGLAAAVLAAANRLPGAGPHGVASVAKAITALGPRATLRLAESLPRLQPAAPGDRMAIALTRISAHSLMARAAADRLARALGDPGRDELRLVATLHDIGKVALVALNDPYLAALTDVSSTPGERLKAERKRLTFDHAAIGALALRRIGLPPTVTAIVDRHHADDATGWPAVIQLADLLAHMASGHPISPAALSALTRRLALAADAVEAIVYDLPRSRGAEAAPGGPSPLTATQARALRGLADGKMYKQIALDMGLAESTVRSHLHNLYRKLDVADRAQAVLLAVERGWI